MRRKIWEILALCIAIIILGTTLFNSMTKPKEKRNNIFPLKTPSFIGIASASNSNGDDGISFLQEEAGISAYVNVGESINIEEVTSAFKSIETVNDAYIIGEIDIAGLPEDADPHAYVHENGWIVSYYSKNAPASKIVQWNEYNGETIITTLEDAIHAICLAIKVPFSTIKDDIEYYDFEYPNANRMMIIIETISGYGDQSDSFNLTIPSECWLYESSWSHYSGSSSVYAYSRVGIDGSTFNEIEGSKGGYTYGTFAPQQMELGISHTLFVHREDYCGHPGVSGFAVILIYRAS